LSLISRSCIRNKISYIIFVVNMFIITVVFVALQLKEEFTCVVKDSSSLMVNVAPLKPKILSVAKGHLLAAPLVSQLDTDAAEGNNTYGSYRPRRQNCDAVSRTSPSDVWLKCTIPQWFPKYPRCHFLSDFWGFAIRPPTGLCPCTRCGLPSTDPPETYPLLFQICSPLGSKSWKVFSFRGALPPDQGLCPWTPLGALPLDPHYRLELPRSPSGPPLLNSWIRP